MAFAVALELPLEEARELLEKAGFAFSHASKFDIMWNILSRIKITIFLKSEALFAFDQSLLGRIDAMPRADVTQMPAKLYPRCL